MIVNRYPGKCQSCNVPLAQNEGFAYKNGYKWFSVCKSTACHRKLGLQAPTPESAVIKALSDDGFVTMPYDSAAIPLLRSMPGARWVPENKQWKVSVEIKNLRRVLEIADQLQLEVSDNLRSLAAEGTQESRDAIKRAERRRADGAELFLYQKVGVEFLALHDQTLLADDMGLGKTVQALVALPENERVILIAPAAVKYNWADEAQQWRPDYKVHICNGKNSFKMPERGEIVIINYEILPDWLTPKSIPGKKYKEAVLTEEQSAILKETTLIADEAHRAKNYKAARTQKISQLSRVCKRVWFLTGTPLMNRPQDLYGVLQAGNMNVLGSWNKFLELFNGYPNGFGGYDFGVPSPEVPERMKRVMLRRLKSEVLKDLPPKTYQKVEVSLDKETIKSLNKFLVDEGIKSKDEEAIQAELEMADLPGFEKFSEIRALLAKSRIPAMLEMVEEYEESETPLLVFSAHKAPIEALKDRAGWAIITGDTSAEERFNIVKLFQSGKLKGVGLTIQAGGVGLTLTRASHALFVDLDWTPAMNIQAEDRLCIAKGQLVAVKGKGYIPIEAVRVGDLVFTKNGNWKPVLNTNSRQHRKLVTTIKYKRFSDDLVCTHDHKLLVKREGSKPQWIEAHSVLPGDFLVTPRMNLSNEIHDELIFPKNLRHDSTQINQFGVEQNNGRYKKIPEFIRLDDESLFAFGLYLAQGFSSTVSGKGRFVSWAVHKKNRHQLERVQKWLETLGVNSSIYEDDGQGIELRGFSIELAHLFEYLFGRTAPHKHIPDGWLDNFSKIQLEKLLNAYLDGDGYRRNSQSEWGTVSQELAMQLNILVIALGNASSLTIDRSYNGRVEIYWKGLFTTNSNPSNSSLNLIDDQYVYHPISSVKTEFAKRGNNKLVVYDLEVQDDESFLVGNAIVHNCRIGQTSDKVLIKRMVSKHPLDRHIQMLLEWKLLIAHQALEVGIKFTPLKPRPLAQNIQVVEETDEELAARIKVADNEANQAEALGKLRRVLARESAKVDDVPEPVLTTGRKAMLEEALEYMIGRCDGAETRDGMGFSKPDASISRWIGASLTSGDDLPFRVLERILCRYRRQLKGQFEEIWKPE